MVKFFVCFWAVPHRTVLPRAPKEAKEQQAWAARNLTRGVRWCFSACLACQADGGVASRPRCQPLPPRPKSLLCSPVEWRWGRRAHRSISKVSDLYGSCSPVCRSECPCPMFNSWQTHAFSVTVAFMASHTILLVQPQPYKDIKKFLWCSYLSQSSTVTTSALLTWRRRHQHDNNHLKSKLFQRLNYSQGQNFYLLLYCCLCSTITKLFFVFMWRVSSLKWEKAQKSFLELFDIWDLAINPQQHTGRV